MSEKNHNDWRQRRPVGRPKKLDRNGNPIYRVPTSIYLDIRMKEWLVKKTGNLSEWIEEMIYKAHQNEYCFWCFDDNIKEVHHGWVCCNDRHRNMSGKGAPSVVLEWKKCPTCEHWFNEKNLPTEIDGDIYCGICKQEKILLEAK
jgi:hypothetical protein